MKIKEVTLVGFSRRDIRKVHAEMKRQGVSDEDEFYLGFTQMVADVVGGSVGTMIQPNAPISIVKLG